MVLMSGEFNDIYIYIHIYICIYICMYTYIYIYIYIFCVQVYSNGIVNVYGLRGMIKATYEHGLHG